MRNNSLLKVFLISFLLLTVLFAFGCSKGKKSTEFLYTEKDSTEKEKDYFGIVVINQSSIGILDGLTQTMSFPLLVGELGSMGGGRYDVVITPNGKTAMVSNFGDSTVYFIDTSTPSSPYVSGSITLSFFAEDIALTPDGTYALVTDGGFAPKIAVIDVEDQSVVEEYTVPVDEEDEEAPSYYHNAVSVAPDGQTVLTADYFNGQVNCLTLSSDGHLSYVSTIDVSNGGYIRPVNLTISPDGETVVVASVGDADYMAFPVLTITGPGQVELTDMVTPQLDLTGAQSVVFNRSGTKAYLHCVVEMEMAKSYQAVAKPGNQTTGTPELEYGTEVEQPNNVIVALDITSAGQASDAGTPIEVGFIGRSQLFGVDTMAMDYETGYLCVSNPTISDGRNYVQIVDVREGGVVETYSFGDVWIEDDWESSFPCGVAFWRP